MSEAADPLPLDRSGVATEAVNPRTATLHLASAAECVRLIHDEDRLAVEAVGRAAGALTSLIEAIVPRFESHGRLIYLGAGTSGRLGVLDASEMPPTFQVPPGRVIGIIAGGDSALRRSSEGAEDDPDGAAAELAALGLGASDTVIGIAAGGTTPWVLGALGRAASMPAHSRPLTALIACSPFGAAAAGVDHIILLDTGPEVVTGSTRMKAGTATKLALNTISTTLMVRTGRVYRNLMVDLRATNAKLRDRAARIVSTITGLNRASAFAAIDAAGGEVKTAIVMKTLGVDAAAARGALSGAGGRLHEVIGD